MASSTSPKNSASTFLPNLGSQREAFLNQVETQIAQYVKKEGKNCLAVIERNPQSEDKTYTPSMISKFPPAFVRFLLDKKYHGHEVESALVAPIVAIISDAYHELLNSNAADLAEFLNGQLAQNIAKLSLQEIREHCAKQAARTAKAASTILKGKGHLVSASVVKKMSLKPIVAHPLDGLFGALWDHLKGSKGLDKGFLIGLIKKKKKDLQKPAVGEVLKRLQELLSKTATMSVTEIIASLISIRLCTGYNAK